MDPSASANIALTYANDKHTDGAGAQLQRIYGIYAISRFLKLPYVHSPLKRIDYQGLSALESNCSFTELESRYNTIFEIPSDIVLPEERIIHEIRDADLDFIKQLRIAAKNIGKVALILYEFCIHTLLLIEILISTAMSRPFLRFNAFGPKCSDSPFT